MYRLVWVVFLLLLWSGCKPREFNESLPSESTTTGASASYSVFRPGNRAVEIDDHYLKNIQPLLARRCVACHACNASPCQFNMMSYEGVVRGGIKPSAIETHKRPSLRLEDNVHKERWRSLGFFSVLDDRSGNIFRESVRQGALNAEHALQGPDFESAVAHGDHGKHHCPSTPTEYETYKSAFPLGGMPLGLPKLESAELQMLLDWEKSGAKGPGQEARRNLTTPTGPTALLNSFEKMLNGDLKSQLTGRYLFEHMYSADLHFETNPGEFYRLVRSTTPPGADIEQIQSSVPTADPKASRVYYRLRKVDRVIAGRLHNPWEISQKDLDRFRELFLESNWTVSSLPGYETNNPFTYFEAIPLKSRAAFMRENSLEIFQALSRGEVCTGRAATYTVDDHFWIWFMDEDKDPTVQFPKLGLKNWDAFYSRERPHLTNYENRLRSWKVEQYNTAFEEKLRKLHPKGMGISSLWNGDGKNPNAWLNVLRHEVAIDVFNGSQLGKGGFPQSIWILSYANFERMYYNTVVHFSWWSKVEYLNESVDWMLLTRTEAEDLYISLFPEVKRKQMRTQFTSWLAGVLRPGMKNVYSMGRGSQLDDNVTPTDFSLMFKRSLAPSVYGKVDTINHFDSVDNVKPLPQQIQSIEEWELGLRKLASVKQDYARYVPNLTYIRLNEKHLYTMLNNRAYRQDKYNLIERQSRLPEHDTLSFFPGLVGFVPNLFINLTSAQAADFLRELISVKSEAAWKVIESRYGVKRSSPKVWEFYDWLHDWQGKHMPVTAAIIDLRYYGLAESRHGYSGF